MVIKAEQERIKTLLRDTITLLCRNGLTFRSEFSVEALIGITLDKDEVMLVSIKELCKSDPPVYDQTSSSEEDDRRYYKHPSYTHPVSDPGHVRRRKRKRPQIKPEPPQSVDEDEDQNEDAQKGNLLDLSTHAPHNMGGGFGRVGRGVGEINKFESDTEFKGGAVVKKEYVDDNWPPAGVVNEETVGGSDSGSSDHQRQASSLPRGSSKYPSISASSALMQQLSTGFRGADYLLHHGAASMVSPGSSPTAHPGLPSGLPMMNGLPFPTLPLPQSHFAQALGRLVGSVPPSLSSQKMSHTSPKEHNSSSQGLSAQSSPAVVYTPSSRSSLPKEAVALMTDWLRKNQHNPYPTDAIKDDFVQKTGLTYNQINYWFTNARRRLLPKWEMQRSMREQELVQQMSQCISHISTPPSGPPTSTTSQDPDQPKISDGL